MPQAMSFAGEPSILVDDNDPAIIYGGQWAELSGLETDVRNLTLPGKFSTPSYGTLHTLSGDALGSKNYTLEYTFEGFGFAAYFFGNSSQATVSCTIDGEFQSLSQLTGGFIFSGDGLSPTTHNLTISFNTPHESISFDWLTYSPLSATPTDTSAGDLDLRYDFEFYSSTLKSGDSLNFTFNGVSAGLYSDCTFQTTGDSSEFTFSYIIDQDPPVNFTLSNPSPNSGTTLSSQLILQTPPLPRGPHNLTITLLKLPEGANYMSSGSLNVQNRTHGTALEAVPSILDASRTSSAVISASSTASSIQVPSLQSFPITNPHHISRGAIGGIAVGALVALLIGVGICIWTLRKSRSLLSARTPIASPFSAPESHRAENRRFKLAQYTTREKTDKYREAFGIRNPAIEPSAQLQEENLVANWDIRRPDRVRRTRYRYHEDGGRIPDVGRREGSDDEDVISLPPNYSTLAGSHGHSRATHTLHIRTQSLFDTRV